MKILAANDFLPLIIVVSVLAFFGAMILIIILVKRHFTSLQIKKDDLTEEEVIQQELDRILVPIEDEDIKKQMVDKDKEKVDAKTSEYTTLTTNLQNATDALNDKNVYKNSITTLLSEIMYVIPKEVQLTSIENPSGKKIVINAQSSKYEQLAYFKALLKSKGVLEPTSVVSSEAVKESSLVKIVIEGDLP